MARDSSFNPVRHVEHECRERIRVAVLCRCVGGERRLVAAVLEARARMSHLIEEMAVQAEVATDFQRVIAPHLRRGRRHRPGALFAVPRQRRLEADQVVAVAADVDRRDAAGKVVQVDAFDAEILRRRQSVVLADRLIVMVRAAEADLLHQCRRPDSVVRPADALGRIGARPRKRLETTVDAERCRVHRLARSAGCSERSPGRCAPPDT